MHLLFPPQVRRQAEEWAKPWKVNVQDKSLVCVDISAANDTFFFATRLLHELNTCSYSKLRRNDRELQSTYACNICVYAPREPLQDLRQREKSRA